LGRLLLRSTDLNCGNAVHLTFNLNGFNSIHLQQTILLLKGTSFSFPSLSKKSTSKMVLEGTTPVPACGTAAILANTDKSMSLCKPHEVQQGQVQDPAHGLAQSQALIQAGWRMD